VLDDELVQVTVGPAHRRLQHAMQVEQRRVRRCFDPPPDRRPNARERHLERVYWLILVVASGRILADA
jgi:hypothetical protein